MLAKAGGRDLVMLVANNGETCLFAAAQYGHLDVAEVRLGLCRQTD